MTARVLFHVRGPDTHANRPLITAVPDGTLYGCTTHGIVYKAVAGAWTNWISGGGSPGATGATGLDGPPGWAQDGDDGPPGPPGERGVAGAAGAAGAAGQLGPAGYDGSDGEDGLPGPQGMSGPIGATGSTGPIGQLGPAGYDGSDGEDGLPGAQGLTGPTGSTGARGPDGFPGAAGQDGDDGERGFPGERGPTGSTGSTGPAGALGMDVGYYGVDGEDGFSVPGERGPTGAVGPAGALGLDIGYMGSDGDDGPMGPPGFVVGTPREILRNWSVADQALNSVDTYLTGSRLTPALLQTGQYFRWRIHCSKTAAGVAQPIIIIRVGTAGAIGDTARCTFTLTAQAALVDSADFEIYAILRNTGASGILQAGIMMAHHVATGFGVNMTEAAQVASAGFDTTIRNTFVGVSMNPGASGVWTAQIVSAEMLDIP